MQCLFVLRWLYYGPRLLLGAVIFGVVLVTGVRRECVCINYLY